MPHIVFFREFSPLPKSARARVSSKIELGLASDHKAVYAQAATGTSLDGHERMRCTQEEP